MPQVMHVWPEAVRHDGEFAEWKSEIDLAGSGRRRLWYRIPAPDAPAASDPADAFAIGTIFSAMRHAGALHIHGCVSTSLLANLTEFQSAWNRWRPERYRIVEIRADAELEAPPAADPRAVMAFSGGLDSSFAAWRHTLGRRGRLRQELGAALMVHGFDIPLSEPAVFARAADNSRCMLESVGLRPLTMATNFRELGDDWEDAHGAAIVSALHLLKRDYGSCVVASSHTYETLRFPWGSNPVTDGLLSSAHFAVLHDGCGFSRRQKAASVAAWPEAMKRLRVCWEGPEKDRNCGVCLRCVGTAICFAVERKLLPDSLPVGDLAKAIGNLARSYLPPTAVIRLSELQSDAIREGIDEPWVAALGELVTAKIDEQAGRHRASAVRLPRRLWRLQRMLDRVARRNS